MAGLLLWLTGRWALLVLVLLPVLMSVTIGQVDLLMAAAIVVGFRWPAAWALPILTKVTPGVGLLWFAVRREWRSLAIALGATAAIVAISFAINADAWLGWLGMLGRGQFPRAEDGWYFDVPLGFRLAMAVIVIIWGARTDRRWVVPLAAVLGMPTVWINSPTILVAVIPLIAAGASTPAGRWLRRGDVQAVGDRSRTVTRGGQPQGVRLGPKRSSAQVRRARRRSSAVDVFACMSGRRPGRARIAGHHGGHARRGRQMTKPVIPLRWKVRTLRSRPDLLGQAGAEVVLWLSDALDAGRSLAPTLCTAAAQPGGSSVQDDDPASLASRADRLVGHADGQVLRS